MERTILCRIVTLVCATPFVQDFFPLFLEMSPGGDMAGLAALMTHRLALAGMHLHIRRRRRAV